MACAYDLCTYVCYTYTYIHTHPTLYKQARSECNFLNPCVATPQAQCHDPDSLRNGTKLVCTCPEGFAGDGLHAGIGCYALNQQCHVPVDVPLAQHTYSAVYGDGMYRDGRLDSGTAWLLDSAQAGPWAKLSLGTCFCAA